MAWYHRNPWHGISEISISTASTYTKGASEHRPAPEAVLRPGHFLAGDEDSPAPYCATGPSDVGSHG